MQENSQNYIEVALELSTKEVLGSGWLQQPQRNCGFEESKHGGIHCVLATLLNISEVKKGRTSMFILPSETSSSQPDLLLLKTGFLFQRFKI